MIVGIATPNANESAVGIIRISGEKSLDLASKIFKSKNYKSVYDIPVQKLSYGNIVYDEKIIDEVLFVYFKAPYSYTTENLVEIHSHGNFAVIQNIMNIIIKLGARVAERGEFTKRAFLGGRLDLSQAESVMDMISSKTIEAYEIALKQVKGSFQREISTLINNLTDIAAHLEVIIDYPDEDLEDLQANRLREDLSTLKDKLESLISKSKIGRIIKDGINVGIIGVPNVGKSSLMNALLQIDRAIVTNIPGTTRDTIREEISISGIPVDLIDTAGIRETDDFVEQIGVEKSKEIMEQSQVLIFVISSNEALSKYEKDLLIQNKDKKMIVILNKNDLENKTSIQDIKEISKDILVLSASIKYNQGIDEFKTEFEKLVLGGTINSYDSKYIINARCLSSLERAFSSISNSIESLDASMPVDLIQIDIIEAYNSLGEISGKTISEDVFNRIFEKFCLGK